MKRVIIILLTLVFGMILAPSVLADIAGTTTLLSGLAANVTAATNESSIADNPSPEDNDEDIAYYDLTLQWDGSSAISNPAYRIYLDDSLSPVQNAESSALKATQSSDSYTVDVLNPFTTYYWRVDILDGSYLYPGTVWQFQTKIAGQFSGIPCLSLRTDIDYDCHVSLEDLAIVASQWLSQSCPVTQCADIDDSLQVDIADLGSVSVDWDRRAGKVVIYEIMADNELDLTADPATNIADNFGDYSDWIEIRNLSDIPQDLEGWFLADDKGLLDKWEFPDIMIGSQEYLIVYASGRDISVSGEPLHTNFSLQNSGEYLALVKPDLTIAHEFSPEYPSLDDNQTYGLTLLTGEDRYVTSILAHPTPEQLNAAAVTADQPAYSQPSGLYTSTFNIELSVDDPDSEIRYTLDGSVPQATSTLYTSPLTITQTTRIRARVFHPTLLPGAIVSRHYLFLAGDVQGFTSNLPVIVIENFDAGSIPPRTGEPQSIAVAVFEPDGFTGWTSMIDEAELVARAGIRRRGKSTRNNPKGNYKLEFRDEKDWDKDYPLLSMPSDSDWVLHAPYKFDKAMIRNSFMHQLGNDIGQYSVRTRFVEMFVNEDGGNLSDADYAGVYVVMEQIKRGSKRVDITHMDPLDVTPPDVTGGYILAIDQADPGDTSFTVGTLPTGGGKYLIKYPQEDVVSTGQKTYAEQFIDDLIAATYGQDFKDPVDGFRAYIDEDAAIDHHLLNMLAKNVDALRLSTYMSKDRNEKLKFGPIWDFDRSMDSFDGRDNDYDTWLGSGTSTNFFTHDWWNQFFQDDDFRLHYVDRWYHLREGAFSTSHITTLIDSLAAQIAEAQVRNFDRWPEWAPPSSWQWEVDHMKWWLQSRVAWVDSQMAVDFAPKPPVFNQDGGDVTAGFALTMASQAGGATYTDVILVAEDASVRAYEPLDNSLALTWTDKSFTPDSNWTDGSTTTAVGYDTGSDYDLLIDTDLELEIRNVTKSVLCRIEFTYDGSQMGELHLNMKYDDGFVAYINGTEVCRSSNVSNDIPGQAAATNHESSTTFDDFDISSFLNVIDLGTNILAIHGINSTVGSSDMLILPKLIARVLQFSSDGDIYYTTDGSDPRLFGGATSPTAAKYTAPVVLNKSVKIRARSKAPLWSSINEAIFSVGTIAGNLRITEIMYHPTDPTPAEITALGADITDEDFEFIELKNIGSEAINLNLVQFTDGIDFTFGDYPLAAGDYAVLVKNQATFAQRYSTANINIVPGVYIGSLDNGGEEIVLRTAIGTEIHDFDYKDGWYELTDGMGYSLTVVDSTSTDPNSWDSKLGWRSSLNVEGTPGIAPETTLDDDSIVINELLAHSHYTAPDWIELHNTTGQDIDISGWFLSDEDDASDPSLRMKYEIPAGTIVPDNDYYVFYQDTSFGSLSQPLEKRFGLSEGGDESVYLYSGTGGEVTGLYQTQQKFDASDTGVTFGRYEKLELSGGCDFVRQNSATPNGLNSGPLIPDVVITEIYYAPVDGSNYEYLELHNRSGHSVTLMTWADTYTSETNFTTEMMAWHIEGISYDFPDDTVLAAGERVIVARDPDKYSSLSIQVFGPCGKLDNDGEEIELQIPGDQEFGKKRYWIPIEKIDYDDVAPWPISAYGGGDSLNRININTYGRDYSNWNAATPTAGF